MFNSQKINNDPEPWRARTRLGNENKGIRYETEYDAAASQEFMGDVVYDTRPKYDNNPNPLLLSFRWDMAGRKSHVSDAARTRLFFLSVAEDEYFQAEREPSALLQECIDHAKRVLEKLVNVYG